MSDGLNFELFGVTVSVVPPLLADFFSCHVAMFDAVSMAASFRAGCKAARAMDMPSLAHERSRAPPSGAPGCRADSRGNKLPNSSS